MKTTLSIITVFAVLCLLPLQASSKKLNRLKYDSLSCLKLEGKILNADETQDECIIELIGQNEEIDTLVLKDGKLKFRFVLNKNNYYAIRISKPGYLSKLICVNTEMIHEMNGVYAFEFETRLIKEIALKKLNKDILDFPVAIIYFDYEMECFSYSKEYSSSIKREMYDMAAPVNKTKRETLETIGSKPLASAQR